MQTLHSSARSLITRYFALCATALFFSFYGTLFLGHQSVYGQTVTPTPDELFFPLIGAERSPLRPQFLDGVAGILEQGTEVRFAHTFQSGTGEIYLIVGATTEIEQKISNLIPGEPAMGEPAGAAPIEAMVTGEVVYMDSGYPLIIASDIVSDNEGPENGPPTTVTKFSLVNLVSPASEATPASESRHP